MCRYSKTRAVLVALVIFCLPSFFAHAAARSSDLNKNNIPDETEDMVVMSASATLAAGEYQFKNLVVSSSTTLTLASDPLALEEFKGVSITAQTVAVESGSTISADGTGYTTTVLGPGTPLGTSRSGASHGGSSNDNTILWYGSSVLPRTLGSAGRYKAGGGAIEIHASNVSVAGTISSRGTESASGGSILIFTDHFTGSGTLSVLGGRFYASANIYGPGAGGRIAVHSIQNDFNGTIDISGGIYAASGGVPAKYAPSGTLALIDTDTNTLAVTKSFRFQENDEPHQYSSVVITGSAEVYASTTVNADLVSIPSGQLSLAAESKLSTPSLDVSGVGVLMLRGGTIAPAQTIVLSNTSKLVTTAMYPLVLEATMLEIKAGAVLSALGAGYQADGPGTPTTLNYRAGASYGGLGTGASATSTYGDAATPTDFGSGPRAQNYRGGGVLSLTTKQLIVDGTIESSGNPSASGGSVLINTKSLSGGGTIAADGGNFATTAVLHGAGGGGRVAVYYQSSSTWSGIVRAAGGRNASSAGAPITYAQNGSVLMNQVKTGPSSVLFLPGIMGSRLYEESDVCDNEGVIEQERWFSTNECNQMRLKTDFTGQPLHNLYTKPEEESVIDDIFVISPLYEGFLDRMAEEKSNEVIADYRAVPYDWRLTLNDILKTKKVGDKVVFDSTATYQQSYIYQSLQELVSSSDSGKVTIVAHSNGGLVAKALILEMQAHNDPLLDKIDNLILVAVPQEGTPDAVVSILHGAELGGGFILNQNVGRQIVNTAPFSHHLLPSEQYFSGGGSSVQTPVVRIEPGSATDAWRTQFGAEINTYAGMRNFMSKDSGRTKPATDDLLHPEVVDNYLFSYADRAQLAQSTFVPPSTMKVAEVAGTGVSTFSSLTYFTDKECISRSIFSFFQCTEYRDKLGYRVMSTYDGDGTVVLPSALAMSEGAQVDRVWVGLDKYNDDNDFSHRVHRNILEVSDIQDFILNIVESTTSRPYSYLDTQEMVPNDAPRLVFQLHSPLDMWVSTQSGEVGSTTDEIEGGLYKRIGELQYIEVPATEKSVQVHLTGQKTGSFTFEMERWQDGIIVEKNGYVAVPTATGTKVTAEVAAGLTDTVLKLDHEGDGVVDAQMNTSGEVVVSQEVSYLLLITTTERLSIQKPLKQTLLTLIKSAEYYANRTPKQPLYLKLEDALLNASAELIKLYTKKRYISAADSKILLDMIKALKDKQ